MNESPIIFNTNKPTNLQAFPGILNKFKHPWSSVTIPIQNRHQFVFILSA